MSPAEATAEIHLRLLTALDYSAVVGVWTAAGVTVGLRGRESEEAFRRQVTQFPDLYLGASHGDQLIGVVLGSHDGRKGWINRLAVRPEYRRRGVASKLIARCDEAIRAQGIEIVCALVEEPNMASRRVFTRAGFADDVPVRYFRKLSRPGV